MPKMGGMSTQGSDPLEAGLYVVGTPIGNLDDMTLRGLETLRGVDAVLAEDTRHTRKLCSRFEIPAVLVSCHRHNEAARAVAAVERIRNGEAVALVTDSGMPGISDPGARVVAACREAGLPVTVAPGPCAVSAAVALSGFPGNEFVFEGFLPVKSGGRGTRLAALTEEPRTVVLYESPHRLLKLLGELAGCMPERRMLVGRELTKRFEECRVGTAGEVLELYRDRTVKGELVIVLEPMKRKRPARDRATGRGRRHDDAGPDRRRRIPGGETSTGGS